MVKDSGGTDGSNVMAGWDDARKSEFEKLKKEIKAILISSLQHGVTIEGLNNDYADLMRKGIDHRRFGCDSVDSLLRLMPDVVQFIVDPFTRNVTIMAVSDAKTRHVEHLVEGQRYAGISRFGGIVSKNVIRSKLREGIAKVLHNNGGKMPIKEMEKIYTKWTGESMHGQARRAFNSSLSEALQNPALANFFNISVDELGRETIALKPPEPRKFNVQRHPRRGRNPLLVPPIGEIAAMNLRPRMPFPHTFREPFPPLCESIMQFVPSRISPWIELMPNESLYNYIPQRILHWADSQAHMRFPPPHLRPPGRLFPGLTPNGIRDPRLEPISNPSVNECQAEPSSSVKTNPEQAKSEGPTKTESTVPHWYIPPGQHPRTVCCTSENGHITASKRPEHYVGGEDLIELRSEAEHEATDVAGRTPEGGGSDGDGMELTIDDVRVLVILLLDDYHRIGGLCVQKIPETFEERFELHYDPVEGLGMNWHRFMTKELSGYVTLTASSFTEEVSACKAPITVMARLTELGLAKAREFYESNEISEISEVSESAPGPAEGASSDTHVESGESLKDEELPQKKLEAEVKVEAEEKTEVQEEKADICLENEVDLDDFCTSCLQLIKTSYPNGISLRDLMAEIERQTGLSIDWRAPRLREALSGLGREIGKVEEDGQLVFYPPSMPQFVPIPDEMSEGVHEAETPPVQDWTVTESRAEEVRGAQTSLTPTLYSALVIFQCVADMGATAGILELLHALERHYELKLTRKELEDALEDLDHWFSFTPQSSGNLIVSINFGRLGKSEALRAEREARERAEKEARERSAAKRETYRGVPG